MPSDIRRGGRAPSAAASSLPSPLPRVLVVVLAWNGRTLTEACLESVLESAYPELDVLVVDNASSDDTVAVLSERFGSRITLVQNDRNLLFAGGMNIGLQHALSAGYDFVLLLNNDVVADPNLVQELVVAAAQDTRIAAVGPKIYYFDRPDVLWFAGGVLSLWRGWSRHLGLRQRDRGQFDVSDDVDYLTGCAILMRCEALQEVGDLDHGFTMYSEDADWCFRARKHGYRLVYVPSARLWHRVSASSGPRSYFKARRRLRSQFRFLRRHARWYHWMTIPWFTLVEALRAIWMLLARKV